MISDSLIHLVNDLQDALASVKQQCELNLPQIAVVGSQSSGKTSVLESLVGRDFLPRGSGIVTRCPLILKLVQTRVREGEKGREYGIFSHKPGVEIENFEEIRQEIERQTVVLAGAKGVVPTPISLAVYSPNVISLTVVDLPGVVMTHISGQDQNIVQQIEAMVLNFIKNENTIILAITPANSDLANSTAINLARRVDPEFDRTIGVLTKLDIMDRGTNAVEVLEGRLLPLKRGWIGVVNRSQEDTNNRLPLAEARRREMDFFRTHPVYSRIADRQGTAYLAHLMSSTLLMHIQNALPDLMKRVDDFIKRALEKQDQLGGAVDEANRESRLIELLRKYSEAVNHLVDGQNLHLLTDANTGGELIGGARIDRVFHEHFVPYVRTLRALPQLTDDKLRETTLNCNGMQATLFPSDRAFNQLAREQIKRLDSPAQQCITFVHSELNRITSSVSNRQLDRYPKLRDRVIKITATLLEEARKTCALHIRTNVEAEQAYINVKHPKLVEAMNTPMAQQPPAGQPGQPVPPTVGQPGKVMVAAPPAPMPPQATNFVVPANMTVSGPLSEQERQQFALLRKMVEEYFFITKETICDQTPKLVAHLLVNRLLRELHPTLTSQLYKPDQIAELLEEAPGVAAQRKHVSELLTALYKAREILNRVREVPPTQV